MRRSNTLTEKEINLLGNQKKTYITDFDEGLKLFLKNCRIKGLRKDTIEYYERELTSFRRILESQDLSTSPSEITGETIEEGLIEYMLDNDAQATSVNTRLRAVFAFFNFLHKKKYIRYNPVASVDLLKHRKKVVPTFSEKELKILFKVPNLTTFTGLRDYTLMLFLLDTGVRVNELVQIDISDVLLGDNQIVINSKNDYERLVPVSKKMKTALKKYITIRGECESEALFVGLTGERLKKSTVKNRLWQVGQKAGIKCAPHKFRHTFAKFYVINGGDPFSLRAILGHSSMDMVMIYVNLFGSEVREKHKKFSPLDHFKGI